MKFPFPDMLLNNTCIIKVYGEIDSNGSPAITSTKSYRCYTEENVSVIRSKQGEGTLQKTRVAKIIVKGDVDGIENTFKGSITIFGKERKIDEVSRFYNTDQTVHHVEMLVV